VHENSAVREQEHRAHGNGRGLGGFCPGSARRRNYLRGVGMR
jgi:hypothetical protein